MAKATHFNPVDLVCCLTRHDGSHFNLPDYVDHETGFISEKSFDGRDLRAFGVARTLERRHEQMEYGICRSAGHYFQSGQDC